MLIIFISAEIMALKKTINLLDNKNIDINTINYSEAFHVDNSVQPISSNYVENKVQTDVAPADSFLNLLINPWGGGC